MLCLTITLSVFIISGYATFSGANKDTCDLYAAVGQALRLPLGHKTLAVKDGLKWTHNNTLIFHRNRLGSVHVGKPEDISADGSLQLRNPNFTSAGIYKAEVLKENGVTINQTQTTLCMMEIVSIPKVNVACDYKSSTVMLTCYVNHSQGLVFIWTQNKNPLTETRPTLSISLNKLKGQNTFSCIVSNKVSEKISDSVPVTCSEAAAPPALVCFRAPTVVATVAGGGCLILILVIILAIFCCRHYRHRAQLSLDDVYTLPMAPVILKQADSNSLQYESMYTYGNIFNPLPERVESPVNTGTPSQDTRQHGSPAQDVEQHTARVAEGQLPYPVPKPRTKTPYAPNN